MALEHFFFFSFIFRLIRSLSECLYIVCSGQECRISEPCFWLGSLILLLYMFFCCYSCFYIRICFAIVGVLNGSCVPFSFYFWCLYRLHFEEKTKLARFQHHRNNCQMLGCAPFISMISDGYLWWANFSLTSKHFRFSFYLLSWPILCSQFNFTFLAFMRMPLSLRCLWLYI